MNTFIAMLYLTAVSFIIIGVVNGKVYDRCELARELKEKLSAPDHQLATWVCIAQHESNFDTSAIGRTNGDGSGDHGIFQISDIYWCSPPGNGWACGLTCAQLEDDDITDDYACAQKIYKEHKHLSGNGFNAWAVYQPYCSGDVKRYIEDCFDKNSTTKSIISSDVTTTTSLPITSSSSTTITTTTNRLSRLFWSKIIFKPKPMNTFFRF